MNLTTPLPPFAENAPTPLAVPCTFGCIESGLDEGHATPIQLLRHALSGLSPNERLALVGITKNNESGEFIVETNDGPQRLIPLPVPPA